MSDFPENERGEFVDKEPSTLSRVLRILLVIVLLIAGALGCGYFIYKGMNGDVVAPPVPKVQEYVFKDHEEEEPPPEIRKPEPLPEPPKPEPKEPEIRRSAVDKVVESIRPTKKDKDLERKLASGLNHKKPEEMERESAARRASSNPAPMREEGIEPNIDLTVTETPVVGASALKSNRWTIPKGTPISCALETAIQSNQPGLIKCSTTEDVYSADSTIKLLDRGSIVTGEYRPQSISYGKNRIFAIWDRIRTPQGVVINIASPATDALGRAGIGGFIDNHYFERFGTAILISIIADGFNNNTSDYYKETHDSMNDVAASILLEYSRIRPTLHTHQGARVLVFTARDMDLSNVYSLEHNPALMELHRGGYVR